MARGTQTAVLLLCVLASSVLLVDARHLLETEEPSQPAKSVAAQPASADVAEVQEVQQLSQLVGDIIEDEGGLELQAALWKRAKKQGKCLFKGKIVECQDGNQYPMEDPGYDDDSQGSIQSNLAESFKASISTYVVPDEKYSDSDYDDDDDEVQYDAGGNGYAGGKHKGGKHAGKRNKGAHRAALKEHIKRIKANHKLDKDMGYGNAAPTTPGLPHQHYFPRMDYDDQQPSSNPPRYTDPTNQLNYGNGAPSNSAPSESYKEGPPTPEPGYGHPHPHHSHSKAPGSPDYENHPHMHKIHSKTPSSGDYDGQPRPHHIHSKAPKHEESQYDGQYDTQYDNQHDGQHDSHSLGHKNHSKTPKTAEYDTTAYGQPPQKHHIHSKTPVYEEPGTTAYEQPPQKKHHHLLHKHKAAGHKGSNKTAGYGKAYDQTPGTYQEPDTYQDDDNTYGEGDDTYSPPSSQYSSTKDSMPPAPKSSYSNSKSPSKPSYPNKQNAESSEDSTQSDTDNEDEEATSLESKPSSHPKGAYGDSKSSYKSPGHSGAKDTHKESYTAPAPPAKKYKHKSGYERDLQDTIGNPPKPNTKSYKRDPMEYWDEDDSDAEGYNLEVYAQVASSMQADSAAATQKAEP